MVDREKKRKEEEDGLGWDRLTRTSTDSTVSLPGFRR